jgi:hypothetical protein
MSLLAPNFDHLLAMSDEIGTFEHAEYASPRLEHGFCTDDVARVLLVLVKEPELTGRLARLAQSSLDFLAEGQHSSGAWRNRRDALGRWQDAASVEDCWGRSLWSLGAAVQSENPAFAGQSLALFQKGATLRSPWLRATAFAGIGAASVLAVEPDCRMARALANDTAETLNNLSSGIDWLWPEPRLAYANAVIPESMMAVGAAVEDAPLRDRGLTLLRWLLARETRDGHLSVTPAGGSGLGDSSPGFDQQPIEVAAMAAACLRAFNETGDRSWADAVRLCHDWFVGSNDLGVVMWDATTGGGYDGLHDFGPNFNEGAESTLALLSTIQSARSLVEVAA